jgi:hypothetical protein
MLRWDAGISLIFKRQNIGYHFAFKRGQQSASAWEAAVGETKTARKRGEITREHRLRLRECKK